MRFDEPLLRSGAGGHISMNHVAERVELAAADDRDPRGVVSRHPRIDVSPPEPSTGAIDLGSPEIAVDLPLVPTTEVQSAAVAA